MLGATMLFCHLLPGGEQKVNYFVSGNVAHIFPPPQSVQYRSKLLPSPQAPQRPAAWSCSGAPQQALRRSMVAWGQRTVPSSWDVFASIRQ